VPRHRVCTSVRILDACFQSLARAAASPSLRSASNAREHVDGKRGDQDSLLRGPDVCRSLDGDHPQRPGKFYPHLSASVPSRYCRRWRTVCYLCAMVALSHARIMTIGAIVHLYVNKMW
jgi:hypothetical protein